MNKETLEEAAERILWDNTGMLIENHHTITQSMIDLAKWQQDKNKYSVEDLDAFRKFMIQEQNFSKSCLDVFVEQLKKK